MLLHSETDPPRCNLEAALSLTAAGIQVFPAICAPSNGSGWSKRPLVERWQAVATTDRDQIQRWWRQWPYAVPGIPLKEYVVIDADRHGGPDGVAALERLEAENGGLPAGPVTETAGRGLHYVFRQPSGKTLGNRRGALPPGIDVRGAGGWIVAPGSARADGNLWAARPGAPLLADAHKAGTIPEIPAWLVEPIEARPHKSCNFSVWAQRAVELECESVRRAIEGARNETLNKAAFRLGSFVARGWLDQHQAVDKLSAAAAACALPTDEARATIGSGIVAGLRNPAADPEDWSQHRGRKAERGEPKPRRLVSRRLSDLRMRPIEWVWSGRIAVGKHTTLAGEPGVGKSTLLYWIAATVSTGGSWPCGEGIAPKGSVIILSAEDGPEDTVAPRVSAAGGDLDKVHIITATRGDDDKVSSFTLQTDLQALEALIGEIGDVGLVIVDPISSYLGGDVDGHSNTDVRRVVEPLHEMADRLKVAVLTNTHFAKSGASNKSRASHRVIGSTAFLALPRVAFAVTVDPEKEDRRLVLHLKNNIARATPGLAFTLVQEKAGEVGEPPVELSASCVSWETGHVTMTADQAIAGHEERLKGDAAGSQRKRPSPDRDDAEAFLRDILADGPKQAKAVREAAEAAGIKDKPLREARERLVESVQSRGEDRRVIVGFLWRLKAGVASGDGDD